MPSKDSDRDLRINLPEDWELRVFGVSAGWSWSLFNHRLLTSIAPRERDTRRYRRSLGACLPVLGYGKIATY